MNLNNFFFRLFMLICSFSTLAAEEESFETPSVSYTFSGGRLGDNILAYIHAKYISHLYGMPLLYKPFQYSDQFAFDKLEKQWTQELESQYSSIFVFNKDEDFNKFQEREGLYIVPYFPDFVDEYRELYHGPSFDMNWDDKGFVNELRKTIQPVNGITTVALSKNSVNVAVHVRKGGGPDSEHMTKIYFTKFPPEEFYIAQIKRISKLFPMKKLYVHIFTNDPQPQAIVDRFKGKLKNFPVKFGFRNTPGNQEAFVLEDFFSMMKFDCIIRAEANLSYIAAKIGQAKIEIFPIGGHWEGDRKVIDRVGFIDKR